MSDILGRIFRGILIVWAVVATISALLFGIVMCVALIMNRPFIGIPVSVTLFGVVWGIMDTI